MTRYQYLRVATFQFFHFPLPIWPPHMERLARKRSYTIFFVPNPGTAHQPHLWRHLTFPWFIRGRLHSCKLVIVNCEREVKLGQDNDKVCRWNNLEPSGCLEQPVNCIFEDIWRSHLLGADSFRKLSTANRMSQDKARQRQGTSFELFRAVETPWSGLSIASLKTFEGSIIYRG